MSMVAIIPVADILTANASLEAEGFGPDNFSVPAYVGVEAQYGALHAWNDPTFEAAVMALPGVVVDIGTGDPVARTNALIEAQGAVWGAQSPELPATGVVNAGDMYQYAQQLWYVIQTFDRTVYSDPPATYPALIRRVHVPGEVEPWQQPTDQYDAYKLVNPFNGLPDQCTHNGSQWVVTQADGSGNNVWEPGVFGWTEVPSA